MYSNYMLFSCTGSVPVNPTIVNKEDGVYEVSYEARSVGQHQISIQVRDSHINSSPFTLGATQLVCAANCAVEGIIYYLYKIVFAGQIRGSYFHFH